MDGLDEFDTALGNVIQPAQEGADIGLSLIHISSLRQADALQSAISSLDEM